jgi:four helix bundle protein
MAAVARFEDLVAWQKARVLARETYFATRGPGFSRDFGLSSQIQRASVSVMANLAEGFERRRRTEFYRFVQIAKGSCAEVSSHLYVALDVGYLDKADFERLSNLAGELQRILGGLRNSLAAPRNSELETRTS